MMRDLSHGSRGRMHRQKEREREISHAPPPPPTLWTSQGPKPPLGRSHSPPAWDEHLDAPGQQQRQLPSSVWSQHTAVKQGKTGGSVGTTNQGPQGLWRERVPWKGSEWRASRSRQLQARTIHHGDMPPPPYELLHGELRGNGEHVRARQHKEKYVSVSCP